MIADMAADKTVPPDDISEAAMVAAIPGFGLSKLVEYAQRLGQDPDPRSTLRESQQALLRFLAVRDSAAFLARTGLYVIEQSSRISTDIIFEQSEAELLQGLALTVAHAHAVPTAPTSMVRALKSVVK